MKKVYENIIIIDGCKVKWWKKQNRNNSIYGLGVVIAKMKKKVETILKNGSCLKVCWRSSGRVGNRKWKCTLKSINLRWNFNGLERFFSHAHENAKHLICLTFTPVNFTYLRLHKIIRENCCIDLRKFYSNRLDFFFTETRRKWKSKEIARLKTATTSPDKLIGPLKVVWSLRILTGIIVVCRCVTNKPQFSLPNCGRRWSH